MKLSKRTEYAVRALVHLGRLDPNSYVQARDIARLESLPSKFLESVMLTLKKLNLAQSKVGSGGGYRLKKPASELFLGEIIRLLEDETPQPVLHEGPPGGVALEIIRGVVDAAHASTLDTLSLEKLIEDVQKQQGHTKNEMYFI